MSRTAPLPFLAAILVVASALAAPLRAAEAPAGALFPFPALDGREIAFDPAAPCHVIAFLGAGCPVARQYGSRLEEIAREYAGRGVRVIGVDANRQDSAEEFAAAGREIGVTFPLVMDPGQRIARSLGATRTGGVVLLDRLGEIAYAGRIDDQFAPGVAKPEATRRDLVAAIDEVLAGRPVSVARTEPVGCLITFDRTAPADAVTAAADAATAPTFHNDILPMLQQHCME